MYSYRTATPADEASIAALIAEGVGVPVDPETVHAPVGRLADPTADPYTLVATCDDGVVATMSLSLAHDAGEVVDDSLATPSPSASALGLAREESVAHLAYAYVAPAHQSHGVGATMLRRLLAVAVRAGLPLAVVEVWEYDPERDARGLLRHVGFERVHQTGLEWHADGRCRECGAVDCACAVGFFTRPLPESIPPHRRALGGG